MSVHRYGHGHARQYQLGQLLKLVQAYGGSTVDDPTRNCWRLASDRNAKDFAYDAKVIGFNVERDGNIVTVKGRAA